MYAIVNSTTGQEFPRYFKDADALKAFVINSFGSIENAPDGLQVVQLSDSEYQNRVQARGSKENVEMNKNIRTAKEGVIAQEGGIGQYIAPYTYQSELAGKEAGMIEGAKDFFSLPGRFVGTSLRPDFETMKQRSDERDTWYEKAVTAPETGVALAMTPLALLAGGGVGATTLLANSPRLAPFLVGGTEGLTIGAGTSAFQGMTEEEFGVADAAVETLLSGAIGGGLKYGSSALANQAKKFIETSGKFSPAQVEYIYSKLGITRGGTTENLQSAAPKRIGDIANIEYSANPIQPPPVDALPKSLRSAYQSELNQIPKSHTYVSEDLGGSIPSDVAMEFERSINQGMINRSLNPAQVRDKKAILKEFNEWMSEVKKVSPENGTKYLDKLLEDAKYFYQKDPELGQIMLDQIEQIYKLNYALMANAPEGMVKLAPMSDLTSKFGDISATTQYLGNVPKAQPSRALSVTEPGSWWSQTAGRVANTPESAKNVSDVLGALRMPSLVATQDVTNQSLNTLRSKR